MCIRCAVRCGGCVARGEIRFATRRERDFRAPAGYDTSGLRGRPSWQVGEPVGEARIAVSEDTAWWVERAYAEFGRIDVLVNNAGMSPVANSSLETSEELFDKVVGVNLKGPFRLSALVGSRMVAAGGGSIINVTSTGAIRPLPHMGPYSAAKAGLNVLTKAHALEFGPKVRVNAIMAGPFWTDVSKAWREELDRTSDSAVRRIGRPHEIVTTALYLASEQSSYTTGAVIELSGGIR